MRETQAGRSIEGGGMGDTTTRGERPASRFHMRNDRNTRERVYIEAAKKAKKEQFTVKLPLRMGSLKMRERSCAQEETRRKRQMWCESLRGVEACSILVLRAMAEALNNARLNLASCLKGQEETSGGLHTS